MALILHQIMILHTILPGYPTGLAHQNRSRQCTVGEDIITRMDENFRQSARVILRITLVLILTPLLGLGAQSHAASHELRRAQHALDLGMNLAASQHLSRAAQQLPSRPELWVQAGSLALEGGDPQAAVQHFETAAGHGLSESGQLQLGDAYLQTGDRDSARLIWENLANQEKPNPEALERLVRFNLENGDISGATASLQALTTLQPDNAHNYYQLGLLVATRDPEASLVYLARAAELDADFTARTRTLQRGISTSRLDDDPAYRLMGAGRALASLEEWQYAAEAFRQATIVRPDYADAWAYLGEALQHAPSENLPQETGFAELEKALEIDPRSLSATTLLALYWQRQSRYDLALEAIQSATALAPNNPVLQVELGNTLALQGDLEAAYLAYLQAIRLASTDPGYYNFLVGFSLTYDYHVREIALPASRQALLLSPNDPASLDTMGQVLLQLGDLVNAERFFTRAIESDSHHASAHLHLGMLYLVLNQGEQAYHSLSQAVSLAPHTAAGKQAQQLLHNAVP